MKEYCKTHNVPMKQSFDAISGKPFEPRCEVCRLSGRKEHWTRVRDEVLAGGKPENAKKYDKIIYKVDEDIAMEYLGVTMLELAKMADEEMEAAVMRKTVEDAEFLPRCCRYFGLGAGEIEVVTDQDVAKMVRDSRAKIIEYSL